MLVRSIVAGHLLQVVVSLVLSALHFVSQMPLTHCCFLLMRCYFLSCTVSESSFSLACTLHCRDNLVAQGKESKVSAAVVFLPQNTLHFGKCGSDKCYCVEVGISSLL